MTRLRGLLVLIILCQPAWAQDLLLSPFPFSELESSSEDNRPEYEVMTGRVSDSNSGLRAVGAVRVTGNRSIATYEIPRRHDEDEVFEHYMAEVSRLKGLLLFKCEARNCGRSNDWANTVFDRRILYGRDRNQRYLAARLWEGDDSYLVSVYVIRRGNQRLYAHVEQIRYDRVLALEGDAKLLSTQLNAQRGELPSPPVSEASAGDAGQAVPFPAPAVDPEALADIQRFDELLKAAGDVRTLVVTADGVRSSRTFDSRLEQWFSEIASLGFDSRHGQIVIGSFSEQPNIDARRNYREAASLGSLVRTYLRRRYVQLEAVETLTIGPWRNQLQNLSSSSGLNDVDSSTGGLVRYVELVWLPAGGPAND
ncbi:DUF4892 domain-containing protein [Allohahella marinimesophila]|uniref:DUF4892 domain-containing protein n=1 Tax=Allohahella marinimesophila TaxID=1054972 RepID=A0ABP7NWX1_9GAMM